MKTDLYCIHCGKMVVAETDCFGRMFHYNTVQVNNSPDPGTRYDLEECEMKEGFAACPPPEYDLSDYIIKNGTPPFPVAESSCYEENNAEFVFDEEIGAMVRTL